MDRSASGSGATTRRRLAALAILVAGVLLAPSVSPAQTASGTSDSKTESRSATAAASWSIDWAMYLWFAGLEGDVGVRGLPTSHVDESFRDTLDKLDWWPPPVMMAARARRDDLSLFTDFIYLGLEADGKSHELLPVSASAEAKMVIWSLGGGYRVLRNGGLSLDLIAGGRLWYMDLDVTLTGPLTTRKGGGDKTWVDPFVGAAARFDIGHGFSLLALGDVGGFGASSDLTWQALGLLQYRINDSFSAEAGYRYLAVDYHDGGFVADVNMSGPIAGVRITF